MPDSSCRRCEELAHAYGAAVTRYAELLRTYGAAFYRFEHGFGSQSIDHEFDRLAAEIDEARDALSIHKSMAHACRGGGSGSMSASALSPVSP